MYQEFDQQIVASLTLGQLRDFLKEVLKTESRPVVKEEKKNYVYGLRGIQTLLGCSHTQAQRYKDGILKDAIMQYGRKIVVDADKALELFKKNGKCLWLFSHRHSCVTVHRGFVMLAVSTINQITNSEGDVEAGGNEVTQSEMPVTAGMLQIERINDTMEKVKDKPEPRDLFRGFWYEGEVACLFADSNVGKSILALQIAEQIAADQLVIYYDFELSDIQLRSRYADRDEAHQFPDNLYRGYIDPTKITDGDFEAALLRDIEQSALILKAKIIIIDNLTYMCNDSEKGDAAGRLMMKLTLLKKKYGWSTLVIAHTPKRDEKEAIEPRHLAGSKKLYNFFDSVFALGKSCQDPSYRYLKLLKTRMDENHHGENNVLILQLDKASDGNLHYLVKGEEPEKDQLGDLQTVSCDAETIKQIIEMKEAGKSFREIAKALDGVSKSKAQRVYNDYAARKKAAPSARP